MSFRASSTGPRFISEVRGSTMARRRQENAGSPRSGAARQVKDVEALVSLLGRGSAAILTDFRGLNVAELADLRRQIERGRRRVQGRQEHVAAAGGSKRRCRGSGPPVGGSDRDCRQPRRSLGPGEDPAGVHPADAQAGDQRGLVEGLVLTAAQIKVLADLPSRPQLLAKVLGSMAAP